MQRKLLVVYERNNSKIHRIVLMIRKNHINYVTINVECLLCGARNVCYSSKKNGESSTGKTLKLPYAAHNVHIENLREKVYNSLFVKLAGNIFH